MIADFEFPLDMTATATVWMVIMVHYGDDKSSDDQDDVDCDGDAGVFWRLQ